MQEYPLSTNIVERNGYAIMRSVSNKGVCRQWIAWNDGSCSNTYNIQQRLITESKYRA